MPSGTNAPMTRVALLGDEALAQGAIDAGVSCAYGYPGTPSTEIMEYLRAAQERNGRPLARWSANEKTALEEALGVSLCGRRALVTMKHVGLNVAADPFINGALVDIRGGLVLAVADDPGMHSSQNEQDSRFYADFAKVPCLEPADQQQACDMMADAFDLSERFHVPVLVRMVTRLAHSRAPVQIRLPRPENPLQKTDNPGAWVLLPAAARQRWHRLLTLQEELAAAAESSVWNVETPGDAPWGVITTGLARNYFLENAPQLSPCPAHLHIGQYPLPVAALRRFAAGKSRLVVLEEGYPFVEERLPGILLSAVEIRGKKSGHVPVEGELDPDNIREVLELPNRPAALPVPQELPGRPPQLCRGCPHLDTFRFLADALNGRGPHLVASDIGCYSLGALPPLSAIETLVCMGASISMAVGAAEAGMANAVAVIGDSTFLHSGMTGLVDCVARRVPVTILILDNGTVGMTGAQETMLPSSALAPLVVGMGVPESHVRVVTPLPKHHDDNVRILQEELDYPGVSVIISRRECLEWARRQRREATP